MDSASRCAFVFPPPPKRPPSNPPSRPPIGSTNETYLSGMRPVRVKGDARMPPGLNIAPYFVPAWTDGGRLSQLAADENEFMIPMIARIAPAAMPPPAAESPRPAPPIPTPQIPPPPPRAH